MSTRSLLARHYATGQLVRVEIDDGRLREVTPADRAVASATWLAPALVDLQINGYAGVDFQQDDLATEALTRAAQALQRDGCTRFFFTLITEAWPRLLERLRRARRRRDQAPLLRHAIAGWHIEGPFLSPEPGFRGAHEASVMCDPTPAMIEELRDAAGEDPVLLTLAPERAGALPAMARAVALGMRVSLGHSNASAETLQAARAAGATGFTHLGNGCPAQLDRRDNILWRVLDDAGLTVSLIPDTFHVAPALFRLIHRLLSREAVYYTTDAMAAAGAPPGTYTLGRLQLEVGAEGIVRLPGTANLAGSALTPLAGVWRAARMLGRPWPQTWPHFSEHPARFMGLASGLQPGRPADFCLVQCDAAGTPQKVQVFCEGDLVAERPADWPG